MLALEVYQFSPTTSLQCMVSLLYIMVMMFYKIPSILIKLGNPHTVCLATKIGAC